MFYHIFITGCQYNYYDAKHIAHLLDKMGYVYIGNEKNANIIVVLACSVRQKPMDRIYGKIKLWKSLPQKPKIIITGCVLPNDKKKLQDKVDAIIIVDDLKKELPKILSLSLRATKGRVGILPRKEIASSDYLLAMTKHDFHPADVSKNTTLIPIMQGCNNFCTYCAVPYVRGAEKSRPINDIITEIKSELKFNKKHIILLGQNVNSYQPTTNNFQQSTGCHSRAVPIITSEQHRESTNKFVELLEKIDKLPGNFTFNFLSSNPRNFSDELIELLPKLKKWQHILHLPLQSGDDEILKKMNRKYSIKKYYNIIKNLKLKIKNLSVTTDIMVGFPGETKTQFENTVKLCKKIGFSKAYINQYSPRHGTFAEKNLKDNVSRKEKKKRWEVLNKLINQ